MKQRSYLFVIFTIVSEASRVQPVPTYTLIMKSLQIVLVSAVLVIQAFSQRYRPETSFSSPPRTYNVRETAQVSPSRTVPSSGVCPEPNGRYPTRTCDGYIECKDGVPQEKTCPDGLLFNPAAGVFAFPCQYPIDVDCTGREQTQPAQSTEECPHQFGYFRLGDEQNCGQFKNCVDGRGFVFDCPEGLAFNEETYRCDWPDQVPSCNAEAYLGFTCPDGRALGLGEGEFRFYRSSNDCQRYYICINSKPRLYNCGDGRAFNDLINACDGAENVTGCAQPSQRPYSQVQSGQTSTNFGNYRG